MVVETQEATREAIAARLEVALDHFDAPERGRSSWLKRRLSSRVSVTEQGARRWLTGKGMPELPNLVCICLELDNLSLDWLVTGRGPMFLDQVPRAWPFSADLFDAFHDLNEPNRIRAEAALRAAIVELRQKAGTVPPMPKGRKGRAQTRAGAIEMARWQSDKATTKNK